MLGNYDKSSFNFDKNPNWNNPNIPIFGNPSLQRIT